VGFGGWNACQLLASVGARYNTRYTDDSTDRTFGRDLGRSTEEDQVERERGEREREIAREQHGDRRRDLYWCRELSTNDYEYRFIHTISPLNVVVVVVLLLMLLLVVSVVLMASRAITNQHNMQQREIGVKNPTLW
jgi:hypothetical protein